MVSRKFNWVSSCDEKNNSVLTDLNAKMLRFYSSLESRINYQQMVDHNNNDLTDPGIVISGFLNFLKKLSPGKILEVGCGSGRVYQFIEKELNEFEYLGIEISKNITDINCRRFPEANWLVSDAYTIPVKSETADVCFSFYVLEHLVFPAKALIEMMRTVKPNGHLILIFPDFVASGRFSSQNIGLSNDPTAISKLKKGNFFDAFISLYDSRIRLPRALRNAVKLYGSFPVNISPKCLSDQISAMVPDIDAVYIASKKEVEKWAAQKGYIVIYPQGTDGYFAEHSFLSIQKTG